ncbi:MAG: translation initiation factor IF-2 N-terminal domain-containing protein, partial [Clostridia bacterium]|nr:translation initiation factor IF-2 N-terminal domain-containing protein [Clostridia bacterium]
MNKPKIHELAKELNVTSKRLMEKLDEIGIHPKSHMTTLEDDELEKLYKHIGIVKHAPNNAGAAHGSPESKSDHADNTARKNAPRIIRKTEVIIRDELPVEETKDKKDKKPSFVRSAENNDGLMAGYTRGKDSNMISGIRKRSKNEADEPVEEAKPLLRKEADNAADRPKKPVDDILSIKKVAHKPERTDNNAEGSNVKEQENMQKESIVLEKPQVQVAEQDEKVAKNPVNVEAKEKFEQAQAEKPAPAVQATKVETPSVQTEEAPKAPAARAEQQEKPREETAPQEAPRPREQTPRFENQRREGGYQGNRESGYQGNREGGYQGNREGGYQGNREGGYQGNREGGYQGQRQDGFRPREGAGGGYQGQRQGGYQGNREGTSGGYQGNRPAGGYQGNREGGYQGNRPGGYQGNRPGGYQG